MFSEDKLRDYNECITTIEEGTDKLRALAKRYLKLLYDTRGVISLQRFQKTGERYNWDIYLSALQSITRSLNDSILIKHILPVLHLQEVSDKIKIYSDRLDHFVYCARKIYPIIVKYDEHYRNGQNSLDKYDYDTNSYKALISQYASIKTWTCDEDLYAFLEDLDTYHDARREVVLEGPLSLVLQLSEDAFMLLARIPIWRGHGNVDQCDMKVLINIIRNTLRHDFGRILGELWNEADRKYTTKLATSQKNLRMLIPSRESKVKFIKSFESGVLLRDDLSEL